MKSKISKKIKAMNFKKNVSIEPLRVFITGEAGVGKSYLMKIICMFLMFLYDPYSGSPGKPKVFILASTGVAAINKY